MSDSVLLHTHLSSSYQDHGTGIAQPA